MNTDQTVTTDLKVVLNGGTSTMQSATIPFRWFFSTKLIEQQPTHILVVDQNVRDDDFRGERQIIRIDRGSAFLQFVSPGHHRIAFLALKDTGLKGDFCSDRDDSSFEVFQARMLKKDSSTSYDHSFPWEEVEKGIFENRLRHVLAAEIVEVDVPEEFFAMRSESKFGRAVWNWANLWFEGMPRDECAYRKRLITAFTVQPIAMALWWIGKFVLKLCGTIGIPVIRILALFIGFRPVPIFSGMGKIWRWEWDSDDDEDGVTRYSSYRLWRDKPEKIYMPITGFELTFILAVISGFVYSVYSVIMSLAHFNTGHLLGTIAATFLGCVIAFGIVYKTELVTRTSWWKKLEAEEEARKEQEPVVYFEWLKRYSRIEDAPASVNAAYLPDAFRGKVRQRLRITFWATKAKVCRPFPRR